MKIGVFVSYDTPYKPVADITVPNLQNYCKRHDYFLSVVENPTIIRDIVWDRIQVLLEHMNEFDWVVHMDADILVTNHHIPLEEFLDRNIVLSESVREDGSMHLNDGVLFVKNSSYSRQTLNRAWNMLGGYRIFCAQDAFEKIYDREFLIERQKRFNSFLYPEYGMPATTRGNWTVGDFALHLPGIKTQRRVDILNKTEIIK